MSTTTVEGHNSAALDAAEQTAFTRVMLIVAMAAFLVMSLSLTDAWGADGLLFGVCYTVVVAIHAGLFIGRGGSSAARTMLRVGPLNLLAALSLVASGFVTGPLDWLFFLLPYAFFAISALISRRIGFALGQAVHAGVELGQQSRRLGLRSLDQIGGKRARHLLRRRGAEEHVENRDAAEMVFHAPRANDIGKGLFEEVECHDGFGFQDFCNSILCRLFCRASNSPNSAGQAPARPAPPEISALDIDAAELERPAGCWRKTEGVLEDGIMLAGP